MIHPDTELRFINEEVGYGVVAKKFIPKGTITWVLDKLDQIYSPGDFKAMEPAYKEIVNKYSYRDRDGNFVLCWDISKYVNHSFNSNCMATPYEFEIAIRDIHPGEELTDDYGYLNLLEPFRPLNEGTKRKVVYPDDTVKYHKTWDAKVNKVLKDFNNVEQPLKSLLLEGVWDRMQRIVEGREQMDSIMSIHYHENGVIVK